MFGLEEPYHEDFEEPDILYPDPDMVIADDSISREEKITIIENWLLDMNALLDAEDDNLYGQVNAQAPAILKSLQFALDTLKQPSYSSRNP